MTPALGEFKSDRRNADERLTGPMPYWYGGRFFDTG